MRLHLDGKSVALGMAAGVLVMLTLGAMRSEPETNGRFQIAGTHSHALIIDTRTGQVWRGFFPEHQGNTDGDFLKSKVEAAQK